MSNPSGPSEAAVEAVVRATVENWAREDVLEAEDARLVLAAAHNPALGLDRSVCLRDVVRVLQEKADSLYCVSGPAGEVYDAAADLIERKFGGGS